VGVAVREADLRERSADRDVAEGNDLGDHSSTDLRSIACASSTLMPVPCAALCRPNFSCQPPSIHTVGFRSCRMKFTMLSSVRT
jgi:hypothetical protein